MEDRKASYGLVYSEIMRNKSLTPEAKAIYAYLCTFAGAGETCFPSVDLICNELTMGRERFYKHIHILLKAGIIEKNQERNGNRWGKTVYTLHHSICLPITENEATENRTTENDVAENEATENLQINNTRLNSTRLNNTSNNTSVCCIITGIFNEAKKDAHYKGRIKGDEFITGKLLSAGIQIDYLINAAREFAGKNHPADIQWFKFYEYCRNKFNIQNQK